jgi:hypothetical protein
MPMLPPLRLPLMGKLHLSIRLKLLIRPQFPAHLKPLLLLLKLPPPHHPLAMSSSNATILKTGAVDLSELYT